MTNPLPPSGSNVLPVVQSIIETMIDDLELDYDGQLTADTTLVNDLGFASVDFIHLIVEIEAAFQKKLGFHDLLMPAGQYVSDLTLGTLVGFVTDRLAAPPAEANAAAAAPAPASAAPPPAPATAPVIDQTIIEQFRALIPPVSAWGADAPIAPPVGRVLFILSSPRSGSTLFRVMLAGHPALFAPPELHLLTYPDLARRHAALANEQNAQLLTGAIRAWMALDATDQATAERRLAAAEAAALPTQAFYQQLIAAAAPRLLVDKSPTYPMRIEFLERAEAMFNNPLYLHLVRHPCGMIQSFTDSRMEQMVPFMRDSTLTSRQLAELSWLQTNANIHTFLQRIPAERQLRVHYESLVAAPESVMQEVARFLAIPYDPALVQPYDGQTRRMADGLRMAADYSGDLKFHLHAGVDPSTANRWQRFLSSASLAAPTRELAAALGISFADTASTLPPPLDNRSS